MDFKSRVRMSRKFRKDFHRLDDNLADRVLAAILEIAWEPRQHKGNTLKSLKVTLQGSWRYRVGDYRLIYQFDEANGLITLQSFDHRSEAYG